MPNSWFARCLKYNRLCLSASSYVDAPRSAGSIQSFFKAAAAKNSAKARDSNSSDSAAPDKSGSSSDSTPRVQSSDVAATRGASAKGKPKGIASFFHSGQGAQPSSQAPLSASHESSGKPSTAKPAKGGGGSGPLEQLFATQRTKSTAPAQVGHGTDIQHVNNAASLRAAVASNDPLAPRPTKRKGPDKRKRTDCKSTNGVAEDSSAAPSVLGMLQRAAVDLTSPSPPSSQPDSHLTPGKSVDSRSPDTTRARLPGGDGETGGVGDTGGGAVSSGEMACPICSTPLTGSNAEVNAHVDRCLTGA